MPSRDYDYEDFLPYWGLAKSDGSLALGAQLPTRDGRRIGNAHIVAIDASMRYADGPLYSILTDAGSTAVMSEAEIEKYFYPPRWIADVSEVLEKFQRK